DVLVRFQLTKGQSLSDEDIDAITEEESSQRAYVQAVRYLSYRMRSIQEMEDYLKKKAIDRKRIEQVMVRLIEEKLLDDNAFAKAYVRDRIRQTSKGPKIIINELMTKGIRHPIAHRAVQQYDYESQLETVMKWLQKEYKKKSIHSFQKRQEQLKVKLMHKGFEHDIINEAFQRQGEVVDPEEEQRVLWKQADKLYRKHSRKFQGNELKMKMKQALYQKG